MSEGTTFLDASCPKCGRRFGWHGRVRDRPACPNCGTRPLSAQLDADQEIIDEYRAMLRDLRNANPGWHRWREARVAAGLTLRQAARILAITAADLSAIERGELLPLEGQALRMSLVYSGEVVD